MSHKDFLTLVQQFVARYNEQSKTEKGYYRIVFFPFEHAVKLMPEYGNCIMWPEQIFQFAHDNDILMYLTADQWDDTMRPIVTLFPFNENAC